MKDMILKDIKDIIKNSDYDFDVTVVLDWYGPWEYCFIFSIDKYTHSDYIIDDVFYILKKLTNKWYLQNFSIDMPTVDKYTDETIMKVIINTQ